MKIQKNFVTGGSTILAIFLTLGIPALAKDGPEKDDKESSFMRRNTFEVSFDASADATHEVEKQVCTGDSCEFIKSQAGSVKKTQRAFAEVSRVSDIAAVAGIGALGVSQLGMRDPSQIDSLEQVAKIQKYAGYASYATGAADLTMGAVALASHRGKLESLKKLTTNPATQAAITKAVHATESAATKHMLWGAGKVAVGYYSMHLSEQNLDQRDKLRSLQVAQSAVAPDSNLRPNPTVASYSAPVNSVAFGTSSSSQATTSPNSRTLAGTAASRSPEGYGNATSISATPGGDHAGGESGAAVSGSGGAGATIGDGKGKSSRALARSAEESATLESFEPNLLGGGSGGPKFSGGSGGGKSAAKSATDTADPAGALASLTLDPQSAATGINPEDLAASSAHDQAANATGDNRSLFQIIREKHSAMAESGRVVGPTVVSVKGQ